MLYKYAQYKGYKTTGAKPLDNFADASNASSEATKATLEWAVGNGIINGTGDGINPAGSAIRGEAALSRGFSNFLCSHHLERILP